MVAVIREPTSSENGNHPETIACWVSGPRGTGLTCTGVSPRATRYAYRPHTDDRRRAIVRVDSPDSRSASRTTVRSPR